MSRAAAVVLLVVGLLATPVPVGAQPAGRAWLALGDSYSSGEGIPGTPAAHSDALGQDCRRATGQGTDAIAWPAGAYRDVHADLGFDALDFVACTGNISDDAKTQIAEATAKGGRTRWDVVSFSFGGNNIRFADVIMGCVLPPPWGGIVPGCKVTEEQLRKRVDMLVGVIPPDPGEFAGEVTLPRLYDQVAEHVDPGGDVLVAGYPNLVEEVARQGWLARTTRLCAGIRASDVPMLRNVGGYLNEQIAKAVGDADARHRQDGVRFHFIDIAKDPYELDDDPHNRHSNCTDDPWLNGVQADLHQPGKWAYRNRSFHPNQKGHANTARVIADYVRHNVTFDDTGSTSSTPPTKPPGGATSAAAIARFEDYLHAVGAEDIDTVCEIAGPAAKQAEDEGFGPCEQTFQVTFALISPQQKQVLKTATVDPALVEVSSPREVQVPAGAVRPAGTFTDHDLGDTTLAYQNGNWFIID